MSKKINIVVAMNMRAVAQLKEDGYIAEYDAFETIPKSFKDSIKDFMIENVGFQTGPIFCLTRINGEVVSLQGSALNGDLKAIDLLPTEAGDILLEFAVDEDSMVSIGVDKLFELKTYARDLGEENEVILDMLKGALQVGANIENENNVFSFLSSLKRDDCTRYFRIDETWKKDTSSLFEDIEEVSVSHLSKF